MKPEPPDPTLPDTQIRRQAELLRLVSNNVPALIAYYDADEASRCLFANAGYAHTFGFTEQTILGQPLKDIVGEQALQTIEPYVKQVREGLQSARYERELPSPTEGMRVIEVQLVPHIDDGGKLRGSFVLINDITRHRQAERALRESEERLSKFMDASVEGIVLHKDGIINDANTPAQRLIGYSLEELIGRRTMDFIAPDEVPKNLDVMQRQVETAYESAILHKSGQRIPVEFIVRSMVRNGERTRMTIVRDLRDRDAARLRIHHLAHHDSLTGLLNRQAFMEQLEIRLASPRSSDAQGALLFVDLDHFKRVNDSLGHAAGDTLLQTLAQRLQGATRDSDIVARFGGDEFLVLLPGAQSMAHVEDVARKLLESLGAPVPLEGRSIAVTPSVGIALYPQHASKALDLVRNADAAMYEAKQQGRATYRLYDPVLSQHALAALELETQLTQAIARQEFELRYQPQVRTLDGVVTGAEALIRWRHPTRGLVEPDQFVPMAERQRLILPIGHWVLTQSLRELRMWRDAGHRVSLSVNLSLLQLRAEGFADELAQALKEAGVDGSSLELEITERMLMDDVEAVRTTLSHVKALGVRIAIDDFGTGYSSLGVLNQLPIDRIKIDRSFVHGLPGDRNHAAIARAIVMLARSMGCAVIAEGVETEAQRQFMLDLGCEEIQGMLSGAPQVQLFPTP
jgi:diguanylate cyclase (GGDEF)-like protein/PAS domain S-box-containing protein